MFERFTDRARRVIIEAQQCGRHRNGVVDPMAILVGLYFDEETVARRALGELGVPKPEFLSGEHHAGHIPLSYDGKEIVGYALREALKMGRNYIAPEHLLLGLMRVESGARQYVWARGVNYDDVLQVIQKIIGNFDQDTSPAETVEQRLRRLEMDMARIKAAMRLALEDEMTETKRNADLFRRIADQIELHPQTYNQGDWLQTPDQMAPAALPIGECGSVCCIQGWSVMLSATREQHDRALQVSGDDEEGYFESLVDQLGPKSICFPDDHYVLVGAELLGITPEEADHLFDPTWRPTGRNPFDSAELTAKLVAEDLRAFADGAPILPEAW